MVASVLPLCLTLVLGQTPTASGAAESAWLKFVPADSEVIVRVRGLEAVKTDVGKMLDAMSPVLADQAKPFIDSVIANLATQFGPAATQAPLLVVVRLPKEQESLAYTVLVKSDDYAGVQKSLAGGEVKTTSNPGGYDEIKGSQDKKIFTYKGQGFVAFGEEESMVAAVAKPKQTIDAAMNDDLRARLFHGDVAVYVNVAIVQARFADHIDAARTQFLVGLDQAPVPNDQMREINKKLFNGMFDALKVGEGLALSFDFDASGLAVTSQASVKPDSDAAKSLANAHPTAPTLIAKLPAGGATFVDLNLESGQLAGITKLATTATFGAAGKASPEVEKALDRYLKAAEGEMATSTRLADGVQSVSVLAPKDPKEAVSAFAQAMKAMAETKDRGASDFIKEMKVDSSTTAYKGFEFHKVEMTFDLEKMAKAQPNAPGGVEALKKIVGGEKTTTWFGTDGKLMVSVAGQTWEKVQPYVDAVISGGGGVAQAPAFNATRKLLPEKASVLLLVNVQGLARQILETIAAAQGGKQPAIELPKEPAFLGAAMSATPKSYQFQFVLPSAAGPILQQAVMPMLGGVAQ
jgi:hypothetical protein